jgi:hypothetical protein
MSTLRKENNMLWDTHLGKIEIGKDKVVVLANSKGFVLCFYSNNERLSRCELLDADHVARELEYLGYSKSFIDVVLSML